LVSKGRTSVVKATRGVIFVSPLRASRAGIQSDTERTTNQPAARRVEVVSSAVLDSRTFIG
jgi:hypothetical protein